MKKRIKLGLERMKLLLEALGHPEEGLRVVHVAGTNGKGSVCATLSSILAEGGYKTGRYTSPHFLKIQDCIQVESKPISDELFDATHRRVLAANDRVEGTSFEVLTATAFLVFKEAKVDIVVLEVGLGGRLDATNACPSPLVAVITAIGLDHTEFLGDTVEKIAFEKAGIIKPGTRSVVVSVQQFPEVLPVVQEAGHDIPIYIQAKAPLEIETRPDERWVTMEDLLHTFLTEKEESSEDSKPEEEKKRISFPVKLEGNHQIHNACTGVLAALALAQVDPTFNRAKDEEVIAKGLRKVRWPGRMDILRLDNTEYIVDGAHNPQGAEELAQFINARRVGLRKSVTWVVAFKALKDAGELLRILLQPGDRVFAVPFSLPDGMPWIQWMPPPKISEAVAALGLGTDCFVMDSISQVIQKLGDEKRDQMTVVCGSLYLMADFYRAVHKDPESYQQ